MTIDVTALRAAAEAASPSDASMSGRTPMSAFPSGKGRRAAMATFWAAFDPTTALALLDRLEEAAAMRNAHAAVNVALMRANQAAELRIVEAEGLCAREHGLAVVEARKRMQAAEAAVRREHPIMVSMSRLTYEKMRAQFPMEEVQTMQEIIDETRRVAAGKP